MTQKEYILTLLTKLSGIWEYADGLRLIIEQADISQTIIEWLFKILSSAVAEVNEWKKREMLNKWLTIIQKIAKAEEQEQAGLDQELEDLLSQI